MQILNRPNNGAGMRKRKRRLTTNKFVVLLILLTIKDHSTADKCKVDLPIL